MIYRLVFIFMIGLSSCLQASTINPVVKTEGKFVTLGDLFTGLPGKIAGTELLIAPQPGKSLVLNQKWLSSVARKYGVDYIPRSRHEQIKIIGASDIINKDEIENFVKGALVDMLKTDSFAMIIDQPDLQHHIPVGTTPNLELTNLHVNSNQTRFQATLQAKTDDQEPSNFKVSGKIEHTTTVPVLTRMINKGDVIEASDIEWIPVTNNLVNQNVITDEQLLIGASAKRQQLKPFSPLQKHDIAIPYLVQKNQAVKIIGSSPILSVTAKGKALESGTKDDYIKIMNISSKRVIHATVIGPQQVSVDITSTDGFSN